MFWDAGDNIFIKPIFVKDRFFYSLFIAIEIEIRRVKKSLIKFLTIPKTEKT